jgi:FKBP-type peptidyl-prolyl cis-trans isomerase
MNRKSTNITILLLVIVIGVFVTMSFFGLGGFSFGNNTEEVATPTQAFFDELNTTGTVADLRVQTVTPGSGDPAGIGDILTMHYTGALPTGTVFDSSRERGTPFQFQLGAGQVIQGWERGIAGMKVGERRLLIIPASLAYGDRAIGSIPANSTLIFDVELLNRTPAGSSAGAAE